MSPENHENCLGTDEFSQNWSIYSKNYSEGIFIPRVISKTRFSAASYDVSRAQINQVAEPIQKPITFETSVFDNFVVLDSVRSSDGLGL